MDVMQCDCTMDFVNVRRQLSETRKEYKRVRIAAMLRMHTNNEPSCVIERKLRMQELQKEWCEQTNKLAVLKACKIEGNDVEECQNVIAMITDAIHLLESIDE